MATKRPRPRRSDTHPSSGKNSRSTKRSRRGRAGVSAGRRVRRPSRAVELGEDTSPGIDWVAKTGKSFDIAAARKDELGKMLGEEVIITATSGEDAGTELHEQVVPEEQGGPFVETPGRVEFARNPDSANPEDAEPEPLPRAVSDPPKLPSD